MFRKMPSGIGNPAIAHLRHHECQGGILTLLVPDQEVWRSRELTTSSPIHEAGCPSVCPAEDERFAVLHYHAIIPNRLRSSSPKRRR